ncbi:hypothetical protein KCG48_10545 [Proteiniclasticum sp. BAD-10]|uniref:Uncharacterized protein n=1 Tax=Proteiniclasticum sediminis TaxID=2804028 RepID=A0A941CSW6_9CLOT|nr:hypothetical protein [Proteiniclasticum sediminis]MBR0576771.1 hypothetical protein [Proteiniclasticum sediminis]
MPEVIIARGWIWERSENETQWVALRCDMCGKIMTYSASVYPPRAYIHCGRASKPIGYVRKVRMVKG